MSVVIVPHDSSWSEKFSIESRKIQKALGDNVVAVHHIGSTSIPGVLAKPIIDILVETARLEDVDQRSEHMRNLGYEVMGEFGIGGRRYFRKSDENGDRAFHVHAFEQASPPVVEHLAFRDYLLAHPKKAREYSVLKANLTGDGEISKTDYQNAKEPFVRATQKVALEWYKPQQ